MVGSNSLAPSCSGITELSPHRPSCLRATLLKVLGNPISTLNINQSVLARPGMHRMEYWNLCLCPRLGLEGDKSCGCPSRVGWDILGSALASKNNPCKTRTSPTVLKGTAPGHGIITEVGKALQSQVNTNFSEFSWLRVS